MSALSANPVIQSVGGGCCPLSMRMYVNFYYRGGGGGGGALFQSFGHSKKRFYPLFIQ